MNFRYQPVDEGPLGTAVLTIVSLSGDIPGPPEKNFRAANTPKMLRTGHILAGADRESCLIHTISAGGMMAETILTLSPDDDVIVELRPGHRISGDVLWAANGFVGVRFAEWLDLLRVLGKETIEGFPIAPSGRNSVPVLWRDVTSDHRG